MKKTWIVAGCAVLSLSLAGCGMNNNGARDDNNQGPQVMNNQDRPGTFNSNNRNNNRKLTISDSAEEQVEKMEEVEDAHVIISENNAYVTVRMNNNNANADRENNGNARVNDMDRNGGGFIENGTVKPDRNKGTADDGVIDGQGDAGSGNRQNGAAGNRNNNTIFGNTTGGNNAAMGDSTTGRGGSAAGAGNAAGNNTAGDTGRANNYSEVSSEFEQKIADQVRQADKHIHKVFVSVDPDLYNRMGTFADDIRTNRNRDGMFENFTTTMNDFFGGRNQR
jgi:YhcN/YlaJ family sporulation lipoprotein